MGSRSPPRTSAGGSSSRTRWPRIFDGRSFSDVVGLLVGALVLIGARALPGHEQAAAQIAALGALRGLERLYAHLLALGPGHLLRMQTGVLLTTLVNGVETLDRYAATFVPQLLVSLVGTPVIVATLGSEQPRCRAGDVDAQGARGQRRARGDAARALVGLQPRVDPA